MNFGTGVETSETEHVLNASTQYEIVLIIENFFLNGKPQKPSNNWKISLYSDIEHVKKLTFFFTKLTCLHVMVY